MLNTGVCRTGAARFQDAQYWMATGISVAAKSIWWQAGMLLTCQRRPRNPSIWSEVSFLTWKRPFRFPPSPVLSSESGSKLNVN